MSEQAPLTYDQINQQLATGAATVLVSRTDGSISTAQFGERTADRTNAYFGDFATTPLEQLDYKPINNEKLSDQHQEELAVKLAGVALRGAEVQVDTTDIVQPVEKVEKPFDAERANLERAIRDSLASKREAQKNGDGQNSTYWGQVAGQYQRELNNLR